MPQTVEHLKSLAGALSGPERADLAYFLLSSLEPEEEGIEQEWHREITRRVAEIRSGGAIGRLATDLLAELRQRHP